MKRQSHPVLPEAVEACRTRLEQDPLDAEAARELCAAIDAALRPEPVLLALREACDVLDGSGAWQPAAAKMRSPRTLDRARHETLVIHPREKQGRQHRLTSLLGRVLHLLEGNEVARIVARVTEPATPRTFPRLCAVTMECAKALDVGTPAVHIARGEEHLFTVFLDRAPYLCIHQAFTGEGGAAAGDDAAPPLSDAELRFAVGHQLEHVKGGHAALLQISPELLENLVLDQVPFLVRTPIRLASKAIGWTRANVVVKQAGELLPQRSRARRVVSAVGELLPDRDQETVLPETVHEWVWSWIQGVEYSADRAGLIVSGSIAAACAAILRLSSDYAPGVPGFLQLGARCLLQDHASADRPTADRLRELLRFSVSREYLAFLAEGAG